MESWRWSDGTRRQECNGISRLLIISFSKDYEYYVGFILPAVELLEYKRTIQTFLRIISKNNLYNCHLKKYIS